MKKKRVTLIILVLVLAAAAIIWQLVPSYSSVLEANWGFELPVKALCRQVYEADTGASFHGDGVRYHVFSYRYEDYIELMFAWRHMESATLYYGSYSEAANQWLAELDVPQGQCPNFEDCFYWYKSENNNSEILVFWDPSGNKLYIVENLL